MKPTSDMLQSGVVHDEVNLNFNWKDTLETDNAYQTASTTGNQHHVSVELGVKKTSRRSLKLERANSDGIGFELGSGAGSNRRSIRKRPPRKYQPQSTSDEDEPEVVNVDNQKSNKIGKALKIDIMPKRQTSSLNSIKKAKKKSSKRTIKSELEDNTIIENLEAVPIVKQSEIRQNLTSKDVRKIKKILPGKSKFADKQFKCKVCKEGFTVLGSLTTHIRRIHEKEKKKTCPHCSRAFAATGDLTRHIRIHTGDRPFVCSVEDCKKAVNTSGELYKHIRKHVGQEPKKVSCIHCNEKFLRRYELQRHMNVKHSKIKEFRCYLCKKKSFSRKDELTLHMKRHEGIKPHHCVCGKSFTDLSNFYVHIRKTLHMDINIEKGKSKL